jgi:hypothetical protein
MKERGVREQSGGGGKLEGRKLVIVYQLQIRQTQLVRGKSDCHEVRYNAKAAAITAIAMAFQ